MDWIEQATGFSPDGGNGSLELAMSLIVVAVICILALGAWRVARLRLPGE
jgi:cytochrome oxidase assembly protein ShyY1